MIRSITDIFTQMPATFFAALGRLQFQCSARCFMTDRANVSTSSLNIFIF